MQIEVIIEDDRWRDAGIAPLAARAANAVAAHLGLPDTAEASLLACDDARIAVLNAEFRGKPAPTNVLSWPAQDLAPDQPGDTPATPAPDPDGSVPLGDVAIAFDTCAAEARAAGLTMDDHVLHLVIHGLLHLLGYDHVRDPDATLMEGLERDILGRIGVADPY